MPNDLKIARFKHSHSLIASQTDIDQSLLMKSRILLSSRVNVGRSKIPNSWSSQLKLCYNRNLDQAESYWSQTKNCCKQRVWRWSAYRVDSMSLDGHGIAMNRYDDVKNRGKEKARFILSFSTDMLDSHRYLTGVELCVVSICTDSFLILHSIPSDKRLTRAKMYIPRADHVR